MILSTGRGAAPRGGGREGENISPLSSQTSAGAPGIPGRGGGWPTPAWPWQGLHTRLQVQTPEQRCPCSLPTSTEISL